MESLMALSQFRESLKNIREQPNGDILFDGEVIFKWNKGEVWEELEIRVQQNGIEGGNISIMNGVKINDTELHTLFMPGFQKYVFNSSGLLIDGSSSKIGNYQIMIQEALK